MLKDAVRRRFDVLMVWSIDRLGRSVLHVANALAELDAAGVALYSDQQAIDSTTPMGRAMIQMASVFGEQERHITRSRVNAGLDRVGAQGKKLGRPKVSPPIGDVVRKHLRGGLIYTMARPSAATEERTLASGDCVTTVRRIDMADVSTTLLTTHPCAGLNRGWHARLQATTSFLTLA